MKILQVVPDDKYFIWQLYVQMSNFREYGIEKDAIILVSTPSPTRAMKNFEKWTSARIYYYTDTRVSRNYISSIRPHIIAKHLAEHPLDCFLYIDQDVIFTKQPDFNKLEKGETCYLAAAAYSYIYSDYVDAFKKYHHLNDMAAIVGIDPKIIRGQDKESVGGAQYVIKNTSWTFWENVYEDSEAIYTKLYSDTIQDEASRVYHIQIWTADMWALLYNLWFAGKETKVAPEIDFGWPWNNNDGSYATLHNAGIDEANTHLPEGIERFFYKGKYRSKDPFVDDHSYVDPKYLQYEYVKYFKQFKKFQMEQKRTILGVLCTTNKINKLLLKEVIERIKVAAEATTGADVHIVTVSWQEIENNPFESLITPFRELGHLNYILQLKEALATHKADIVSVLEHDVLYPENYFETIISSWDYGKYGVWNDNYIGMNETGFLRVKERHQPFSMLSASYSYLSKNLDHKLNECVRRIHKSDGWDVKYGWTCIEPDNKNDFKILPFTNAYPAIHVNMNHMGAYGTGDEGKNHHFTSHCEVCYEANSSETVRGDWGDYSDLFPKDGEVLGEIKP